MRKSLIGSFAGSNKSQDSLLLQKLNTKPAANKSVKVGGTQSTLEQIRINVEANLAKYKDKVTYLREEKSVSDYITKCINNGIIAIDTETTGLDCMSDEVVGSCLYTPGENAVYIPHKHKSYITGQYLNNQISYDFMRTQYQRLKDSGIKIIMHNAKFDKRMIKNNFGVDLDIYWDTMLAAKILDNRDDASLKGQTAKYINKEEKTYDYSKLFKQVEYVYVPVDVASLYAAADSLITYELYEFQKEWFKSRESAYNLFMNLEMKVLPIVCDMENTGVYLDDKYAHELSTKYHKQLDAALEKLDREIVKYQGEIDKYNAYHPAKPLPAKINWASPQQLAVLFYDILGFQSVDKKAPRGTGEDFMKHYSNKGITLCKAILDYRGISKLLTTYIDKLPEVMNTKTHRIHASFQQLGADCVVGDSYIVTDTGVRTIKEIVGDCTDKEYCEFVTPVINEKNHIEYTSHKVMFENADTIKIKCLYGFTLEGTPNHPIRVLNKNIKQFQKNKSEKVLRELWDNISWKNLEDLQVGDLVAIDASEYPYTHGYIKTNFRQDIVGRTHKKPSNMPEYIDEDFAEFMGMFHADGSYRFSKEGYVVRLHNDHEDVVDRWKYLCNNLFGLVPYRSDKNMNYVAAWNITGPKLEQLTKYLHTGKRNKRVPKEILESRDSVFYAYLKGCSLDSGYNGKEILRYSFINPNDVQAIQLRLLKSGILSYAQFAHSERSTCKLIIPNSHIDKFLSRTGKLFRKSPIKNLEAKKYTFVRNYTNDNLIAVPVKEINHSVNTVYDFTLPETHSFISNGFISHNTGRFSSSDPKIILVNWGRKIRLTQGRAVA